MNREQLIEANIKKLAELREKIANLPGYIPPWKILKILALIKEAGYKSPEELKHYAEIMPPRKRPDLIIRDD